jgi:hypothetical protein
VTQKLSYVHTINRDRLDSIMVAASPALISVQQISRGTPSVIVLPPEDAAELCARIMDAATAALEARVAATIEPALDPSPFPHDHTYAETTDQKET